LYSESFIIDNKLSKKIEPLYDFEEPEKKEKPTHYRWGRIFRKVEKNIFLRGQTYWVRFIHNKTCVQQSANTKNIEEARLYLNNCRLLIRQGANMSHNTPPCK